MIRDPRLRAIELEAKAMVSWPTRLVVTPFRREFPQRTNQGNSESRFGSSLVCAAGVARDVENAHLSRSDDV
jgi:hypothetical protein